METRYKFLRLIDGKIRSEYGDCTWHIGEQQSISANDELEICETGFHCSRRVYDAFSYVQGEILAEVEVSGASAISLDKEAWQSMTIIRAWQWQKQDSVALSIFAAELARSAAWSARSAWAARSAAWSAEAAEAARSAWAAEAAAKLAAWSAWSAEAARSAWAAEAARSAAEKINNKIADWMQNRIQELEPYSEKVLADE